MLISFNNWSKSRAKFQVANFNCEMRCSSIMRFLSFVFIMLISVKTCFTDVCRAIQYMAVSLTTNDVQYDLGILICLTINPFQIFAGYFQKHIFR